MVESVKAQRIWSLTQSLQASKRTGLTTELTHMPTKHQTSPGKQHSYLLIHFTQARLRLFGDIFFNTDKHEQMGSKSKRDNHKNTNRKGAGIFIPSPYQYTSAKLYSLAAFGQPAQPPPLSAEAQEAALSP